MKELDLKQFLTEKQIEMRWDGDVLSTWVEHWSIDEFAKLVESALNDGGIEVNLLKGGTIWLDLVPICEHYGIEPDRILPKEAESFHL